MIQVKKITYSPADIIAMFVTPQNVLPAPAAGYVNNIIGITHDMVFVSAVYTGASYFQYYTYGQNADGVFNDPNVLIAGESKNLPLPMNNAINKPFSTTKNFYVTTDAQAATGDSPIDAYIIFETKLLV